MSGSSDTTNLAMLEAHARNELSARPLSVNAKDKLWLIGRIREQEAEIERRRENDRMLRQALTWCVVNDGETLFDHPRLLRRFRDLLGLEDQKGGVP